MGDGEVQLKSEDGHTFRVSQRVAKMSETISNMLEDIGDDCDAPIPLTYIARETLERVIEYCEHHKDDPAPESEERATDKRYEEPKGWDKEFVALEMGELFEVMKAANFLSIKQLLNLSCKAVAHMIKGKTPDEIKKLFGVEGDFTEEEMTAVKNEIDWLDDRTEDEKAAAGVGKKDSGKKGSK